MTRETREEAIEFIAQSVKSDVDMAKVADAIEALEQEPCEDAISREATLKPYNGLNDEDTISVWLIRKNIEQQPPVTPQPKTGYWIFDEILDRHYYCSECKSMGIDYWDYCPNCGAKMIEPQERSDKE